MKLWNWMLGKRAPHCVVFRDTIGEWRYRIVGANGEKMAASEAYTTKANAIRAVDELCNNPPDSWTMGPDESLMAQQPSMMSRFGGT